MPPPTPDPHPPDAAHVLVAGPPIHAARYRPCRAMLSADDAPRDVINVAYSQPIPAPLAELDPDEVSATPQVSVVDVGPDEPATALERRIDTLPVDVSITTVPAADSLTELGMTIEGRLQDHADTDRPVGVCFDSLTALCLYADRDQADRFLGWLRSRIDTVDGRAHYHADPRAHAEPPQERFSSHFDDVVDVRVDDHVCTEH